MTKALAGKRILLTNDDGIRAPGLEVLERVAKSLSDDVWIVAPETEQSGASHSLTLHLPLRMRELEEKRFAVLGTPTDCVSMAMRQIMKDGPPDLILSGVNRGANIAEDVTYSGTVAGAMEGATFGVPSIALSQTFGMRENDRRVPWATAEAHAGQLIAQLVDVGWKTHTLINVNFPDVDPDDVTGTEVTVQGRRDQLALTMEEREDPRGNPYYWLAFQRQRSDPKEGTDLHAIYNGAISVTPLHLDLTHRDGCNSLAEALKVPDPARAAGLRT